MKPLRIDPDNCRYRAVIGVGGIGSGTFFALNGDHTLGREKSRGGRFLDRRDYCKLHIISHYVHTLLGSTFSTIPIGKVGDDDVGTKLLAEMEEIGMSVQYVERCPGQQTLFSFCLIYPDGSGGNVTTDDSACSKVDASSVLKAEPEFIRLDGRGVALAAPEVPLDARRALLKLGTKYHFFRVASFTSGEMVTAMEMGILSDVDLLAINIDEAAVAEMIGVALGRPLLGVFQAVGHVGDELEQHDDLVEVVEIVGGEQGALVDVGALDPGAEVSGDLGRRGIVGLGHGRRGAAFDMGPW